MNVPPEDVSLGELWRVLTKAQERIDGQFADVNRRLDSLSFVPRETFDLAIRDLRGDVEELKESKKWYARALVASFLLPLMASALVALVVAR